MPNIRLEDSDSLLDSDVDEVYSQELLRYANPVKKSKPGGIYYAILGIILFIVVAMVFLDLRVLKKHPHHKVRLVTHLQPSFFSEHKSERVQIKYGPFVVPGSGDHNGMKNFRAKEVKAPCQGCLITWMQAGLVYFDGSHANADTGMWLHHTVLLNNRNAARGSCKKMSSERFFASGNERSVVDLTLNGTEKVGYWFDEDATVSMATELMNEKSKSQMVMLTITYEYIPYQPHDFETATSIWLDVGGCRSEVAVPDEQTSFTLTSPKWTSTVNGRVMAIVSHLHDGGVHLDVERNEDMVCKSTSTYGMMSEFEHHMSGMDMDHITVMSACSDVGRIKIGEDWTVKAYYDLSTHAPMLGADGKPEGVMGIGVLYVVED